MKKKFITTLLLGISIISFSACSKTVTEAQTTSGNTMASESTTIATTSASKSKASDEDKVIKMNAKELADFINGYKKSLDKLTSYEIHEKNETNDGNKENKFEKITKVDKNAKKTYSRQETDGKVIEGYLIDGFNYLKTDGVWTKQFVGNFMNLEKFDEVKPENIKIADKIKITKDEDETEITNVEPISLNDLNESFLYVAGRDYQSKDKVNFKITIKDGVMDKMEYTTIPNPSDKSMIKSVYEIKRKNEKIDIVLPEEAKDAKGSEGH